MAEELSNLKKQRGYLKSRLSRLENFLKSTENIQSFELVDLIKQLQYKLDNSRSIMEKFETIQDGIELLTLDESECDEREHFERRYFTAINKAESLLEHSNELKQTKTVSRASSRESLHSNDNQSRPVSPFSAHSDISRAIKLPQINLPKFSGNQADWMEFYETFHSLIHQDTNLNSVQKFHYLRAALSDEAADVIHSIKLTEANYDVAIGLLKEQYEDKKIIVQDIMKSIINIPQMSRQNAQQLHELRINFSKHLRSLQVLNLTDEQSWNLITICLISHKFDETTLRDWETFQLKIEMPQLKDLLQFLKEKCSVQKRLEHYKPVSKSTPNSMPQNKKTPRQSLLTTEITCFFCRESHSIYNCPKFGKLTISDRTQELKKQRRCLNCLRRGHLVTNCNSSSCRKCGERHNTLLHKDKAQTEQQTLSSITSHCETLLPTALIHVRDNNGSPINCRIILDTGSQANYITTDMLNKLKLPTYKLNTTISGIGQNATQITSGCKVNIESRLSNFHEEIACLVIPEICNQIPNESVESTQLKLPQHLKLADPSFNVPQGIDMLIGAQYFWNIILPEQTMTKTTNLRMQNSHLGWIISGLTNTPSLAPIHCKLSIENQLHDQLQRFWQLEEYTAEQSDVPNECEQHFLKHTTRKENGQFEVAIPFSISPTTLGESRSQAEKRFFMLEKRLQLNPKVYKQYTAFMQEYENLNHMTYVSSSPSETHNYFLPHHGVIKEDSLTTKLRVVFDGSAKASNNISLNDIQLVGPTIQPDLFSILIRFRQCMYTVCADIEKMYRQVLVRPEDRVYQQILWREKPTDELKTYQLNTVSYGTASAPFLAIRALHEVGNLVKEKKPEIADLIHNNFYVDNLLMGTESIPDAISKCTKLKELLNAASFPLRQWMSNSPEILQGLQQNNSISHTYDIATGQNAKTLGLNWNWKKDVFIFKTTSLPGTSKPTKRAILSTISQIFDPLGLLSPVTIKAKIFIQKLWLEKIDWDDNISEELYQSWIKFSSNINKLQTLCIPRHVLCVCPEEIQLIGFADSSQKAYGACIYLRSKNQNKTTVRLLCAKTRVAPLKPTTIPRLELCAALLLAKLSNQLLQILNIKISSIHLWTDSTTVLSWLKLPPSELKMFVRNRVYDIQNLLPTASWNYVKTTQNPADYLTRGVDACQLSQLSRWWNGPDWLEKSMTEWPICKIKANSTSVQRELKPNVTSLVTIIQKECPINIQRFSNYLRLVRSFSYVLRFVKNCRCAAETKMTGPLTVKEQENALTMIIKFVQRDAFSQDIEHLKMKNSVHQKSKILSLTPFLDENGILHVGGRLKNSSFNFSKKHPIILPSSHHFNDLLLNHEHKKWSHAATEHLLSIIRDQFWPINGRNQAKKAIRNCLTCFKSKPKSVNPIMSNLPVERLQANPPFHITGVDFAGPVYIKDKAGRGCKTIKAYIALFICFSVRAIHLELVSELSTEAFLLCLRRFISRRGKPAEIWSDNGTNFIGANKKLQEIHSFINENQDNIITNTCIEGIKWTFIPPRAPHFGGYWEAGVKSAKIHLTRILGNAMLTFEQFYTTLTQVEALLNSRPLSPLSNDPHDYNSLTPAHFLIGRPLTSLPDPDISNIPVNRLTKFQQTQQLMQHFWQRWHREFICNLQQRKKWRNNQPNIPLNSLVLIREDNNPPFCWPLARVVQLHPGKDGVTRVVTVQTAKGSYLRSVTRLCLLPNQDNCI